MLIKHGFRTDQIEIAFSMTGINPSMQEEVKSPNSAHSYVRLYHRAFDTYPLL